MCSTTPEHTLGVEKLSLSELTGNFGDWPAQFIPQNSGKTWTLVNELDDSFIGKSVLIRARLHSSRCTAKNAFLILRQRFSMMQGVCFGDKDLAKFVSEIPKESILDLEGEISSAVLKSDLLTQKTLELKVNKVFVVSRADTSHPLPFSLDDASRAEEASQKEIESEGATPLPRVALDTRLNSRVFDLRTITNQAIFKLQAGICTLFREYLDARGFTEIHSPKLINAASEGGANVFKVSYFKGEAYLAQSPQFYKQMVISGDMQRVYEIAPVFRAENSFTHRHMTEFMGLDVEMEFKEHYHEVMLFLGRLFLFMFIEIPKRFAKELEIIHRQYPAPEFTISSLEEPVVLEFPQAVKMLREDGYEMKDDEDLSTEKERRLGQLVLQKYGTDFFILDKFPLAVRPFYTMPDPVRPHLSHSYDFFIRGEEIMSGAQRVHDVNLLTTRCKACGVDPNSIKDYVDAFRFGAPPHAGGGIGLERVVMLYLGLKNIRKTSLFPRDPNRITP